MRALPNSTREIAANADSNGEKLRHRHRPRLCGHVVIYSAPCLFAAQRAALNGLRVLPAEGAR